MCVCYINLGSNGCFVTDTALTCGHYMTYIISGVGHPRSDSVVLLVLQTVAYNTRSTGVVLQVSRDNVNLLRMSNISGRSYTIVITYKSLVCCIKILRRLPSKYTTLLLTKTIFFLVY